MKVSRHWLSKYFDQELPPAEQLAEALTFHAFEIEEIIKSGGDDVLDVKVTANRGADCLSHRGIAKELGAILSIPCVHDPLKDALALAPATDTVSVEIEDTTLCPRYIAGVVRGVKVGPSPEWLRRNLEAIGQKSINNIVDATNFVMFNLGQPLHAFDAAKLQQKDGAYAIAVRFAKVGEKLEALDGKTYELKDTTLVIADSNATVPIGVAGVKGGTPAGVSESTTDIIVESANFNGVSVRKTAAALKLRTDASARFEQGISPELAAHGMQAVIDLIVKLAGGEVVGFVDTYPTKEIKKLVSVSVAQVQQVLGVPMPEVKIAEALDRLGLQYQKKGTEFVVTPAFERQDILIPEDLIEEIVRIHGYDIIPPVDLLPFHKPLEVNKNFYYAERAREFLVGKGFSEVFTSVFTEEGERAVLNKVESDRPFLRINLASSLAAALEKNKRNAEALAQPDVKLFEIGTVFTKKDESVHLAIGVLGGKKSPKADVLLDELLTELGASLQKNLGSGAVAEINLDALVETLPHQTAYENLPLPTTVRYQPFSKYPFVLRDIALWVPTTTESSVVENLIQQQGGALLVRSTLFDRFEKEGRLSLAFRLVFQSFDKTLEEKEVNEVMEKISTALKAEGYEIR